jgi:eukaryotic-like serine/threonine-protein kinase
MERGPVPVDEALRILEEIADAIGFLHASGILHWSISPDNILLTDGHALLANCAVARQMALAMDDSGGLLIGNTWYLDPAILTGSMDADVRSDLFSFAAVAYELLTGAHPYPLAPKSERRPFPPPPPPDVRTLAPGVPDAAARWIMAAVSHRLAKRPPDIASFTAPLPVPPKRSLWERIWARP